MNDNQRDGISQEQLAMKANLRRATAIEPHLQTFLDQVAQALLKQGEFGVSDVTTRMTNPEQYGDVQFRYLRRDIAVMGDIIQVDGAWFGQVTEACLGRDGTPVLFKDPDYIDDLGNCGPWRSLHASAKEDKAQWVTRILKALNESEEISRPAPHSDEISP